MKKIILLIILLSSVGSGFVIARSNVEQKRNESDKAISGSKIKKNSLKSIKYNNPDLTVDLGSGLWAWPIPMDYDNDGDNDLLVVCNSHPHKCTFFFENIDGNVKMPTFKPPVNIGKSFSNLTPSYINGWVRLLDTNKEIVNFKENKLAKTKNIYPDSLPDQPWNLLKKLRIRANQWKYVDYDGDNVFDLIVAIEDLTDYGWDNAFDKNGKWKNGPLHGYIYCIRNSGTNDNPVYAKPFRIRAANKDIDLYGRASPNFYDFDNDGDLDIICGEFLDKLTYFQNIGSNQKPLYTAGKILTHNNQPIKMYLEMIIPVAFDWDNDGDMDLIVGDEDGRVALIENTGKLENSIPQFLPPVYFQQKADNVKVGALSTPFAADWDNDGNQDIIAGDSAGDIYFVENLNNASSPKFAAPKKLCINNEPIRIQAGENGSIQGPCEAKWGYTTPIVADWDSDGLNDIIINSIWGKIQWYKNIGTAKNPKLAPAQSVKILWQGKPLKPKWNWWNPGQDELVTQWRTTPCVIDLNNDGLNDLVMLDHEGYLAFFERIKKDNELFLTPGKRIFYVKENGLIIPFRPNPNSAGKSGRRQFCMTDWDGDGKIDIMMDSINADFYKNISTEKGKFIFENKGHVDDLVLAGHSIRPTIVDWDKNNIPDLLIGAEDGMFYYLKNPRANK
jgi:hypothetical protein